MNDITLNQQRGVCVETRQEILDVLDEILGLGGRTRSFTDDTPLLGAIPELDSMAVVAVINTLEERFGFVADDDEIDGSTFATVGALNRFVLDKVEG